MAAKPTAQPAQRTRVRKASKPLPTPVEQRTPQPTPVEQRALVRKAGKPHPTPVDEQLAWTYETLAAKAQMNIGSLRRLVRLGMGPRVVHIGRHHRFMPRDVVAWLDGLRDLTEA